MNKPRQQTIKLIVRILLISAFPWFAFAYPVVYSGMTTSVTEINPDKSFGNISSTGGRINRLAMAADKSAIYAASEWGGLYKSTDGGKNWLFLKNHKPKATWDVAVHPTDASIVYATSFYDGRINSLSGINVSVNAGTSWTKVQIAEPPPGYCDPDKLSEPSAFGIAFNPDDTDHIYIGTNCGLARTIDGGASWTLIDPSPGDEASIISDVIVHHNGVIDVVGFDGHARSTDMGANWITGTAVSSFPFPSSNSATIAASPDESYVLFGSAGTALWESVNGGDSWSLSNPPGKGQGRVPFVKINDREGDLYDLWYGDVELGRVDGRTPSIPASGGQSRLDQNTWESPFVTGAHADVGDLLFEPNPNGDDCPILFANDGGVHVSTDQTDPACHSPTWTQPEISPHALWLWALNGYFRIYGPEGLTFLLLAGTQDNGAFSSEDSEENKPTWKNQAGGDVFDIIGNIQRLVYLQCCLPPNYSKIMMMKPLLGYPTEINDYPPGNLESFHYGDNIALYADDAYVAVTDEGVFITSDIAQDPVQWTELGNAPTGPGKRFGIKVSKDQVTPVFFLQTGKLDLKNPDQIFRYAGLADNGTWDQIQPPGEVGGFSVYDVHPTGPDLLIASHVVPGQEPKMIRTLNGGLNWQAMPGLDARMTHFGAYKYQNLHGPYRLKQYEGYPQPSLLAFDPAGTNIVVAGAEDTGMFISSDGGNKWGSVVNTNVDPIQFTTQTPHITRPHFAAFKHRFETSLSRYLYIFAGTRGRGVFRIGAKVPKDGSLVNICDLYPDLCSLIPKGASEIEVSSELPEQIFSIALDKFCPEEGACPGCGLTQTCPPNFNLHLDGLDPDTWEVGLYTGGERGEYVSHTLFRSESGVILSFKPDRDDYVEGRIGDYVLALTRMPGGKPAVFKFQHRLQVSDEPPPVDGVAEQF